VWTVRGQKQQLASCQPHQIDGELRFVEFRVVEHNDGSRFQFRQQFRRQPFVKDIRIASAAKEHRRDQFVAEITADQTGARTFIARSVPVDFLSDESPAVTAVCCRREACFIQVEDVPAFLGGFVKLFQEAAAILFIALRLCVPRGFFYG
jgi:hypothetical protein